MRKFTSAIALILSMLLVLSGCGNTDILENKTPITQSEILSENTSLDEQEQPTTTKTDIKLETPKVDLSNIPAYSGKAYVAVNNNVPFFQKHKQS